MAKLVMHKKIEVCVDAFSSGQVSSKLWLCDKLEDIKFTKPQTVWIYGGWQGILSFLLLSRNVLNVDHIRSFDIDPSCEQVADTLLENWVWQNWKFKAFTGDCNNIDVANSSYGSQPDIIINTSSEHFVSNDWYSNIPTGTVVAIQSNNMPNSDHHACVNSAEQLSDIFKMSNIYYLGNKLFKYPTWEFTRYMIIGKK